MVTDGLSDVAVRNATLIKLNTKANGGGWAQKLQPSVHKTPRMLKHCT